MTVIVKGSDCLNFILKLKIVIFIFRGVYGHTHGEYPWERIEDFAVKPSARLVGNLDLAAS